MNGIPRTSKPIAVVHLALKSYGLEAFEAFVDSYRRHPAGIDHDLVVALKGFSGPADAATHYRLLEDFPFHPVFVPDHGLDIGTYFHIAGLLEADYFCFLNSRTLIMADDWLAKLAAAFADSGVGLAGATSSFQSLANFRLFSARRPSLLGGMRGWVAYALMLLSYPPFPNPHIRTNGVMVSSALWRRLRVGRIDEKADAMMFESGWRGLTRQVRKMGLRAVIVDRDGIILERHAWPASETFWQGEQSKLLIADNQTRRYSDASREERIMLTSAAWQPVLRNCPASSRDPTVDVGSSPSC